MASTLRPEFGPPLPELLAPRLRTTPGRMRVVLLVLGALLLVAFAVRKALQHTSPLNHDVLVTRPIAFTLGYRDGLVRVKPGPGEALRLEKPVGSPAPERLTIAPFRLPPYRGDPAGLLPILASRSVEVLRRAYPTAFRYRGDGRVRINLLPGHQVLFQTQLAGRTTYGKRFFLLPDEPGARDGVTITLVSARSTAVSSVGAVGAIGVLKGPLRSFRFGTERP